MEEETNDIRNILQSLLDITKEDKSVKNTWNIFKKKLDESIKNNIPHKTAKNTDGCPQLNRYLKQLVKKRDRFYKRKNESSNHGGAVKYKKRKQDAQRELASAYWKYKKAQFYHNRIISVAQETALSVY